MGLFYKLHLPLGALSKGGGGHAQTVNRRVQTEECEPLSASLNAEG